MFSSTLAREGWLLIVSEKATLTREVGYVKGRVYELLRLKEIGTDLHFPQMKREHNALLRGAYRTFGSWHKACAAAGLRANEYQMYVSRGYYTDDRIRQKIVDFHNSGMDLSGPAISKKEPSFYAAATTRYRSWYNALEAAGISPDDYRRQRPFGYWTKSRVIDELQRLNEFGEDLSYSAMEEHGTGLVHGAVRSFGNYEKALKSAGLDYEKIRKDRMMESFIGRVFEKHLQEVMNVLQWRVQSQKRVKIGDQIVRPDFIDIKTGLWIDAKVNSWSTGVVETILKYRRFQKKILIIYLKGKRRKWASAEVDIKPVSDYFMELAARGRDDLVHDLEKLKRGIVRPEMQAELERFSRHFR